MIKNSLVSVILATYNGEAFLSQQLESIFNQTYLNLEIIAIDDGSTDSTVAILNEHAARHANIKVIVNEQNLGFVKNFEKGCGASSGYFIALCDQDDYWHADKIKRMVEAIGEAPMIYCDSFICDQRLEKTGKQISDIVNCQPFNNCLQQAIFCRIYGHATLFTRQLYIKACPFLPVIPHDWWLSYIATLNGGIKYLPEPLVFYRQHAANLFGAVGGKKRQHQLENKREKQQQELVKIRKRVQAFYDACPNNLIEEKKVLRKLVNSYKSFSLANNIRRVNLFLFYRDVFLAVKKHSASHRFFFSLKMFFKIK